METSGTHLPTVADSIPALCVSIYMQPLCGSAPTWTWEAPEVDDNSPIETSGCAVIAAYMGCDPDDCVLPQAIEIGGWPGYLEPAPPALMRPETKPYYDDHVEGSRRALVGFLVFEHC